MESFYMFKSSLNKIIKSPKNDCENDNEDETVLDFTNSNNNNEIISRFSGNDILPVNYIVNEDSDEDLLQDRNYAFIPRFNRRGHIRIRRGGGNHRFVRNIEDTISFESNDYINGHNNNINVNNINGNNVINGNNNNNNNINNNNNNGNNNNNFLMNNSMIEVNNNNNNINSNNIINSNTHNISIDHNNNYFNINNNNINNNNINNNNNNNNNNIINNNGNNLNNNINFNESDYFDCTD